MKTARVWRGWLVAAMLIPAAQPAAAQSNQLSLSASELTFTVAPGNATKVTQTISVSASPSAANFTAMAEQVSSPGGWLSVSPTSGTTPATLTVTVDPSVLTTDGSSHLGRITVNAPGAIGAYAWVKVTVSSNAGISLVASPASVVLTGASGVATVNEKVILSAATGTSTPFSLTYSTASGGNWLTVGPSTGSTPAELLVTATQTGLPAGAYQGSIYVTPTYGGPVLTIPVTLFANGASAAPGFALSTTSLSFAWQTGTAAPPAQSVAITSLTGAALAYTATTGSYWIRLSSPASPTPNTATTGVTGTNMTVGVDPTGLTNGTYNGTINVSVSGYPVQTINLTLTVGATTLLVASPASLTFSYGSGSPLPPPQILTITSTSGAAVSYNVTNASAGWLIVTPTSGSTGAGSNSIYVSVSPAALPTGSYAGAIYITPVGTNQTITVSVILNVGNVTPGVLLYANPGFLTFEGSVGGAQSSKTLTVTGLSGTAVNFAATALSTGGWLTVSPQAAVTPATLTVTANPGNLTAPGSYSGTVVLTTMPGGGQQMVNVTFTAAAVNIAASPSSLSFTANAGGAAPVAQSVDVSAAAATQFTATSDAAWLQVTPTSGATPARLTVTPNIAGLTPGTYNARITIAGGAQTVTVGVVLTIQNPPPITVSPASLTFNFETGSSLPAPQSIRVTSATAGTGFTARGTTVSGGGWLVVGAANGSTPTDLPISVNPLGLQPGIYTGAVAITGSGGGNTQNVVVTLNVTAPSPPLVNAVVNAASWAYVPLAPGLMISIVGANLGPETGTYSRVVGGRLETSVAGTRVLFDGIPAPLLFVRRDQINAVVPYEIYGQASTRMQVETANGLRSAVLNIQTGESAPAIFAADSSGRGQGAVLNENSTLNSAANPAALGSVIVLYATGEGLVSPAVESGRMIGIDLRKPMQLVSVSIGGVAAAIEYAGSAPTFVSGLMQVNARIPINAPRGPAVPVLLQVGGAISPSTITVAIQ